MAILLKGCKSDNFESHNSLKLSFTNIRGLLSNFIDYESFSDDHLNWFNWFHPIFLEGGLLVILIDCMIFLSPFLDVTRISLSIVSFLAQLQSFS